MKIEAYEQMITELRKENSQLKRNCEIFQQENLYLQRLTRETALQNKNILSESKEILSEFTEIRKLYNKLQFKYEALKKCYNNLVNTTTVRLKAEDFYILYNVKNNKYYLFLNFENETQTQIEITKDVYYRLNK